MESPSIVKSLGLTNAPVPTLYRLDKEKWVPVPGALEDRFALEDEVVKSASKVRVGPLAFSDHYLSHLTIPELSNLMP